MYLTEERGYLVEDLRSKNRIYPIKFLPRFTLSCMRSLLSPKSRSTWSVKRRCSRHISSCVKITPPRGSPKKLTCNFVNSTGCTSCHDVEFLAHSDRSTSVCVAVLLKSVNDQLVVGDGDEGFLSNPVRVSERGSFRQFPNVQAQRRRTNGASHTAMPSIRGAC